MKKGLSYGKNLPREAKMGQMLRNKPGYSTSLSSLLQLARTNSRGVKLILMSATMEVSKFEEYFEYPLPNGMKGIPGIVRIPEKENYPIGEYFLNTVATGSSGLPGSAAVPSDDQQLDFSVVSVGF